MQSAPTDKLLKPPPGGGKSKEKCGFRSAERCLRSLSRQTPVIPMESPEEVMVFIGKPDGLLAVDPGGAGDKLNRQTGRHERQRLQVLAWRGGGIFVENRAGAGRRGIVG